jgi:hypothetical protein
VAAETVLAALEAAAATLARLGARHALMGGAALAAWARIRATADVDILLHVDAAPGGEAEAVAPLVEALRAAGFAHMERADRRRLEGRFLLQFWYRLRSLGLSVRLDLWIGATQEEKAIIDRSVPRRVDGFTLPVVSCEDLILLKLAAGRAVDLADARELVQMHRDRLDASLLRGQAARLGIARLLEEVWDPGPPPP